MSKPTTSSNQPGVEIHELHRTVKPAMRPRRRGDPSPTLTLHSAFQNAFDFLNDRLFKGELPQPLITVRAHRRAYGYFWRRRFTSDNGGRVDEIAMNPRELVNRPLVNVLATLTHEGMHQYQHLKGTQGKSRWHNLDFHTRMKEIGLVTSSTGKPGGERVGVAMSQYMVEDGPFARAADELIGAGWHIPYAEVPALSASSSGIETTSTAIELAGKAASKTPYACDCEKPNRIWGRPGLKVLCLECRRRFRPLPRAVSIDGERGAPPRTTRPNTITAPAVQLEDGGPTVAPEEES